MIILSILLGISVIANIILIALLSDSNKQLRWYNITGGH